MTPNELRAEAAGIEMEWGGDSTSASLKLRAAADEIERLSEENEILTRLLEEARDNFVGVDVEDLNHEELERYNDWVYEVGDN